MHADRPPVPRDLRAPVALVLSGALVSLFLFAKMWSAGVMDVIDGYSLYAIAVTGLYMLAGMAALTRRWMAFFASGITLFTINVGVTFAADYWGVVGAMQALTADCPCMRATAWTQHGPVFGWNLFVFAFSLVALSLLWRALLRRVRTADPA